AGISLPAVRCRPDRHAPVPHFRRCPMRGYFARLNGPLLLIFLALLAGCSARTQRTSGINSDELTREELSRYNTVGEAVQALRSGWLNRRTPVRLSPTGSATEANPVWVYRDGTRVGGPDVLRNLSTVEVAE